MLKHIIKMNKIEDLITDEIRFEVPLDWNILDSETIEVFARVVYRENTKDLPYLFYLQGGPGFESPRVSTTTIKGTFLAHALENYKLVLLDQRGTGLSSPISDNDLLMGADKLCEKLKNYRADSIVKDCEQLRKILNIDKINLLGQSFGGFCILNYISNFSLHLDKVYFTGGISSINLSPEKVYATTFEKVKIASKKYYTRFPEDLEKFKKLINLAKEGKIILTSGEVLSVSRLRSLGSLLGSDNGWFSLHSLLELEPSSNAFINDLESLLPFSTRNPIYLILHESCYADGYETNFAANRAMPEEFILDETLLTAEHVDFSWFDTVPSFRKYKEVALKLSKVKWGRLYSSENIKNSNVKGAAAIYYNDIYVPFEFSIETAKLMPNVKLLITSEYEHSGLRTSGTKVISSLFDLANDKRVR